MGKMAKKTEETEECHSCGSTENLGDCPYADQLCNEEVPCCDGCAEVCVRDV